MAGERYKATEGMRDPDGRTTYGKTQDSLVVYQEELTLKESFPIDESQAYSTVYTWNAGQLAAAPTGASGNVAKVTGTGAIVGILYDDRNSSNDETKGSNEVTVITGPSGLKMSTDQLATVTFAAGETLRADTNGNVTNAGSGAIVGTALGPASSSGWLDFIFHKAVPA